MTADPIVAGPPEGWRFLGLDGPGMTNYDRSIDDGLDEVLRAGGVVAQHAAWNFCGYVWFADGLFHEQVIQHHVPVAVVTAATLPELMEAVNDEWGWE